MALLNLASTEEPVDVAAGASLDAAGFKAVTELCCPMAMETFFNRVLEDSGVDVCSRPHVQGLMHWFSCVPEMDFDYVLDVMNNGNPCKYWALKGSACPVLSVECAGHHCGAAAPIDAPTPATPTDAPTDAPTGAPTDAPTGAPTDAPTDAPTPVPTTTTTTNKCQGDVELEFWESKKTQNNIQGVGPDAGDEYLRLSNMGTHEGKTFDFLIASTSDAYTPPLPTSGDYKDVKMQKYNGVYGFFGYLSLKSDTHMDLKFTVVESGTDTELVLPKFFFTFFDMDTGNSEPGYTQGGAEVLSARGFKEAHLGPNTELEITDGHRDSGGANTGSKGVGWKTFGATVFGDNFDNPSDPMNMTAQQMNRAVTFEMENTASFEATYTVLANSTTFGRDIYFAGRSQIALLPCQDPSSGEAISFIAERQAMRAMRHETHPRPDPETLPQPPHPFDFVAKGKAMRKEHPRPDPETVPQPPHPFD